MNVIRISCKCWCLCCWGSGGESDLFVVSCIGNLHVRAVGIERDLVFLRTSRDLCGFCGLWRDGMPRARIWEMIVFVAFFLRCHALLAEAILGSHGQWLGADWVDCLLMVLSKLGYGKSHRLAWLESRLLVLLLLSE